MSFEIVDGNVAEAGLSDAERQQYDLAEDGYNWAGSSWKHINFGYGEDNYPIEIECIDKELEE